MGDASFKKIASKSLSNNTPEGLFRDLIKKNPNVKHLWSHQADILREYQKLINSSDISLELPTGTGKTLVGLLIGLYRMNCFGEKILYLCPTKQLANQVHSQSIEYGIDTHVFTGRKTEYNPKQFTEYIKGNAIAISTYSSLFNIKPRFEDPNIIILDDAHSSENLISSFWSLNINRFDNTEIYFKIVSLFEDIIPKYLMNEIPRDRQSPFIRRKVEMIPALLYWDRIEGIREIIDDVKDGNLFFQWHTINNNLDACNMYVSWNEILIRPWIPPSLMHRPFLQAKQRIYMSATLGSGGGELERIIGIERIDRIPVPPGWEKQGSGRRFFIFPDYSFDDKEYMPWLIERINTFERTLVLCPDNQIVDSFESILKTGSKHSIIKINDIEDTLESFIEKPKTILILANRYDGLDLPGESCRHLVLLDLPAAINIQERFLHDRLAIVSLLRDRIVTRLTQAVGRTTRGDTDYSLITIIGRELFDFYANNMNRYQMHPEIQAEIEFGINQSNVTDINHLTLLIDLFLNQGEEWKEADKDIKIIRDKSERKEDEQTQILFNIAKYEVKFQYYLWNKNYDAALVDARRIVDILEHNRFGGYKGLWCYFAGNIAEKISKLKSKKELHETSMYYYKEAAHCSNTISWFSEFFNSLTDSEIDVKIDEYSSYAVEKILENLSEFGSIGNYFERKIDEISKQIKSEDPVKFEVGLTQLGELLGFQTFRPNEEACPDSIWRLGDQIIIIFEAKSQQSPDHGISVQTCREANGHYNWSNNDEFCQGAKKKIVVVVSPRELLKVDAAPHSSDLYYMNMK